MYAKPLDENAKAVIDARAILKGGDVSNRHPIPCSPPTSPRPHRFLLSKAQSANSARFAFLDQGWQNVNVGRRQLPLPAVLNNPYPATGYHIVSSFLFERLVVVGYDRQQTFIGHYTDSRIVAGVRFRNLQSIVRACVVQDGCVLVA